VLELPYKGGDVSLFVILPPFNKQRGIGLLTKRLNTNILQDIVSSGEWRSRSVEVSLPKFNVEQSMDNLVPVSSAVRTERSSAVRSRTSSSTKGTPSRAPVRFRSFCLFVYIFETRITHGLRAGTFWPIALKHLSGPNKIPLCPAAVVEKKFSITRNQFVSIFYYRLGTSYYYVPTVFYTYLIY